jgi:hypothetical protein
MHRPSFPRARVGSSDRAPFPSLLYSREDRQISREDAYFSPINRATSWQSLSPRPDRFTTMT